MIPTLYTSSYFPRYVPDFVRVASGLIFALEQKVRNWFQNNTEKRPERLPTRIHQSFHPLRIFGHKNRDLIRDALTNENKDKEPDDRAYIIQWNETARRLWDELPDEEKQPYIHLAELWSVQGPDDELKPW